MSHPRTDLDYHTATWTCDPASGSIFWSDEMLLLLGYSRKDAPDPAYPEGMFISPEGAPLTGSEMAAFLRGQAGREMHCAARRADHRVVNLRLTVQKPEGLDSVAFSGLVEFISEVTQAGSRPDDSREVAEKRTCFFLVLSPSGKIRFADRTFAARYADAEPEEVLGTPIDRYMEGAQSALWSERERRLNVGSTAPVVSVCTLKRADGKTEQVVLGISSTIIGTETFISAAGFCGGAVHSFCADLISAATDRAVVLTASGVAVRDRDMTRDSPGTSDEAGDLIGKDTAASMQSVSDWESRLHPREYVRMTEAFRTFAEDPDLLFSSEVYRILHEDGNYRTLEERVFAFRNEAGQAVRFTGAVRDITEQKERERYRELMGSVVHNTNDAVLITRTEPTEAPGPPVIYANPAFEKLTGYSSDEVCGQPPLLLRSEHSSSAESQALEKAMRGGEKFHSVIRSYRKDGTAFLNSLALIPLHDEAGWHTHWAFVCRDVTFRKNYETQKTVTAGISHVFAAEESLVGSADETCRYLCELGGFSFAEIWLPDAGDDKVRLISSHASDEGAALFYERSSQVKSFRKGEGLPGTVWEKLKTERWDDIAGREAFVRRKAAASAEMKTAIGVPLTDADSFCGVLVVGLSEMKNKPQFDLEIIASTGRFLGAEITRKRIENELQQFFNAVDDIICSAGFDGKYRKMNPAGLRILGHSESKLYSTPFFEFVHPDDLARTKEEMKKLAKGVPSVNFENRYLTRSGEVRWLSWTSTPLLEQGIVHAVAKDITERKKLEELLNSATSMARIGAWEVDVESKRVLWSDITCEIHEMPHGTVLDLNEAVEFYRADYHEGIKNAVDAAVEKGAPFDLEAVIVTANGRERCVRVIGRPEFSEERCKRLYGGIQDVHDEKEAELRLKRLADNLPGVLFQYHLHPDGSDNVTYVSRGSERIWGLTPEECTEDVGKVWKQIEDGGSLKAVSASVAESARTMTPWYAQMRNIKPDGNEIWLEGRGTPRKMPDGTVVWDSLLIDVSEKKELEILLKNTNRLAKMGSWELDIEQGKAYWSEGCKEIHGVAPDYEPTLDTAMEFYPPGKSRDRIKAATEGCINEGRDLEEEVRLVTAKGRERWVRVIARAERRNGETRKIYGSVQDITERKEAVLRLQRTAENLPGVIFQYVRKADGTDATRHMSHKSVHFWGLSPAEAMADDGKVWSQIEAAGDLEMLRQTIDDSARTLEPWTLRWNSLRPDGKLRKHEGYGSPFRAADDTVVWDVLIMDVTQRHELEDLLKRTSEISKTGAWELNLNEGEQGKLYWSDLTRRILEVDEAYDSSLESGYDFYVDESRKKIEAAMEALLSEGTPFDLELLIKTGQGNERWVRVIGAGNFIEDRCVHIFGSFQDIHERKTAEFKLRDSLKTLGDYKFALDQAAIIAITDRSGIIEEINDNFCSVTGYRREELIGNTHALINSGYHDKAFFTDLWKTIASGKVWRGEIKNRAKNGSFYWVDTTIVPFTDQSGKPFRFLAIRFEVTERKEIEEKIRRTLTERNIILEGIGDGFIAVNRDWKITYWNRKAEEILERGRDEVLGQALWDIFPDAADSVFYDTYNDAMETGETRTLEAHYDSLDLWADISAYPSESGLSIFFKRVNEQRKAREELLLFKMAIENSKDGVTFSNPRGENIYLNPGFAEILGHTTESLRADGGVFEMFKSPETAEKVSQCLLSGGHWRGDIELVNKSGNAVDVYLSAGPVLNDEHEMLAVYGIYTDITERKRIEKALKASNERFEMVARATNDAVWDWDIESKSFYRGEGFKTLFGEHGLDRLVGIEFWQNKIHPDDADHVDAQLRECLDNPSMPQFISEYRYRKSGGEYAYVINRGIVIRDERGKPVRMVGAISDITYRKSYEESLKTLNADLKARARELELTNAELEQFAYVASHDLQEPLRMVTGFMEQLEKKYGNDFDERAKTYIEFATGGAKRMKRIITDLLEFSRAGKFEQTDDVVDLNSVLEDYKNLRRSLISETKAKIVHEKLPVIYTAKAPLAQIFHNLLDNALKYVRPDRVPHIEVACSEKEDRFEFSVKDNGIGIDPEYFDKVFVLFHRLHNHDEYSGTGMGLAIVKKNVESLGGEVWLTSEPDEGSVFFFTVKKS